MIARGPSTRPAESTRRGRIDRLRIENYRSIGRADIPFGDGLTILVGPNGAGKSNVLDALRFLAEAMSDPLAKVLSDRGGINEVRRRSNGHPRNFSLRLDFSLGDGGCGNYVLSIGSQPNKGFVISGEVCCLLRPGSVPEIFHVREGSVAETTQPPVAITADACYLRAMSGNPVFRPAYDLLKRMCVYNINPAEIRRVQTSDPGEELRRDGSNIAAVLRRLGREHDDRKQRIESFLQAIVPGIVGVEAKALANMETIEFRQRVAGAKDPWSFPASGMSDGTLRALGVLVAIFQRPSPGTCEIPIVGIEEPEVAVHPFALGILLDALHDAAATRQILVTSHSPDLLERVDIDTDRLFAVAGDEGRSVIADVDPLGIEAIRERLTTAGELLRQNRLQPDPDRVEAKQGDLFADLMPG